MRTIAVVGKNFGDEGKGLAVDFFSLHADRPLVVRHNGGAQSGHTVERKSAKGERFIFHELSSGSLRSADTLWIDSFYPDLYKLGEEMRDFRAMFGFCPNIYAMEDTNITVPDDVLLNMALEISRGSQRHGSCGMGINECDLRTGAGYGLSLGAISKMTTEDLYCALENIRNSYVPQRLKEMEDTLTEDASEYIELLSNENVLKNATMTIMDNMRYVHVLSRTALEEKLNRTSTLIFETGQGLLLDRNNKEYSPHVTASDTGIENVCAFLEHIGYGLDEVVYVSRSYVTRHGAGALPCECAREEIGCIQRDETNEPNSWQGQLRYARHENERAFVRQIEKDLERENLKNTGVSLFLTHLNETDNCVVMKDRKIPVDSFIRLPEMTDVFDRFYLSDSRYSDDVRVVTT